MGQLFLEYRGLAAYCLAYDRVRNTERERALLQRVDPDFS